MDGAGRLTLATRQHDRAVVVSVSDTGCGIPKSVLNKLFDPFFTTKDPGRGTGLGLSIVQKLVSKYRGRIRVESQEGQGTTFTVEFPAAAAMPQETQAMSQKTQGSPAPWPSSPLHPITPSPNEGAVHGVSTG
jgi:signal transduction histidine kinase